MCFSPFSERGTTLVTCLLLLITKPFQKTLLLKERICFYGSKFFPLRIVFTQKGGKNENARVATLECLSIHLKTVTATFVVNLGVPIGLNK